LVLNVLVLREIKRHSVKSATQGYTTLTLYVVLLHIYAIAGDHSVRNTTVCAPGRQFTAPGTVGKVTLITGQWLRKSVSQIMQNIS